jgi:hypothetical protein
LVRMKYNKTSISINMSSIEKLLCRDLKAT